MGEGELLQSTFCLLLCFVLTKSVHDTQPHMVPSAFYPLQSVTRCQVGGVPGRECQGAVPRRKAVGTVLW